MNKIVSTFVSTLGHFQNFALLYSRVGAGTGAGAAGAGSIFLPGAGSIFLPGAGAAKKWCGSATLSGTFPVYMLNNKINEIQPSNQKIFLGNSETLNTLIFR
jgi:hypothetical protein